MLPFLSLARTRSFRLLHPFFSIHTQDETSRHFVAIGQLHNYVRNLLRIAFRAPVETPQHLEHRTHSGLVLRQQLRRVLSCAPRPIGSYTAWLQCADLDAERRDFHRQGVAETAHSPLSRVIRRIAGHREPATDRRHLKDVTAPLLAHHGHGGPRCVHHPVKPSSYYTPQSPPLHPPAPT